MCPCTVKEAGAARNRAVIGALRRAMTSASENLRPPNFDEHAHEDPTLGGTLQPGRLRCAALRAAGELPLAEPEKSSNW